MKRCPRCNRTYSDENLNFCLEDGELLTQHSEEEPTRSLRDTPPPTVVMDPTRITNPVSWPQQSQSQQNQPVQRWQPPQQSPTYQPNYAFAPHPMMMVSSPSQTLAVVSLCLGIGSITIGWCCSLGLLLSPAALITGGIALAQIKKDPNSSSGKGMAIAGMAIGGAFIVLWVIFMILWGLANLLPAFLQTR